MERSLTQRRLGDTSGGVNPVGRVVVAMSGGTDSSVAAAMLHARGVDIVGVTMHLIDAAEDQKIGRCCAPEDRDDARRVCDALGIPHYVVDEREAFLSHVIEPFVHAYSDGRTPAPCVKCNQHVKLNKLVALADAFGATHVATGHYARLETGTDGRPRLFQGRDEEKDQSYFLFGAPPHVLSRMLFPLGEITKDEVREIGRTLHVHNADKPDSQELCFVPDGNIGGFVERNVSTTKPGYFRDATGQVVGEHGGVHQFTVGQRKGLGLSGGPARYVLRIVPESGDVVVGDADGLLGTSLSASDVSWTAGRPTDAFDGAIRIRHRHRPADARIIPTESGFRAEFASPQRAITPGQAAVVYRGDEVVAGGFIC